jgi:hypothetical protein
MRTLNVVLAMSFVKSLSREYLTVVGATSGDSGSAAIYGMRTGKGKDEEARKLTCTTVARRCGQGSRG